MRGTRVGGLLLDSFLRLADGQGAWTVQSSIFPENDATVRLHEAAGFRVVGRRERIALMTYGPWAGQWRDTVILERRVEGQRANSAATRAITTASKPARSRRAT